MLPTRTYSLIIHPKQPKKQKRKDSRIQINIYKL